MIVPWGFVIVCQWLSSVESSMKEAPVMAGNEAVSALTPEPSIATLTG